MPVSGGFRRGGLAVFELESGKSGLDFELSSCGGAFFCSA